MIKLPSWITPSTVLPHLATQEVNEQGWVALRSGEWASLVCESRQDTLPSMMVCFDWGCSSDVLLRAALSEGILSPGDGGFLLVFGFSISLVFLSAESERQSPWICSRDDESLTGGGFVIASGRRPVRFDDYDQKKIAALYESLDALHQEVLKKVPARLSPVIEAMESLIS